MGCRRGALLAEQSDETLVLCVQKDLFVNEAFIELLENRYGDPMLRWFRGFGTESNLAFDLKQGVVMKCYVRRLATFQHHDPNGKAQTFYRWLYAVCRRHWIDAVVRPPKHTPIEDIDAIASGGIAPDSAAESHELQERVDAAIAALPNDPKKLRDAFRLSLNPPGYSAKVIAQKLGVPVQTVYALVCEARKLLYDALGLVRPPDKRGRKKRPPSDSVWSSLLRFCFP